MNKTFSGTSILFMGSLLLLSCGASKEKKGNPANAAVPVNLYEVQKQTATYFDTYPGTVTALSQVDLRPEVEGYITGIFFKEGDHVHKGQKLYEIDRSKYAASYEQAQAAVRVAQSNLQQAQQDADRYIYLNKHDAVAKQTLDHAMTALQNAKDQVADAKQGVIKAQTDLNYSIVTAPFDGTIGLSQVKLGTSVSVGQTVLNTISSDDPMGVDFVVDEKQLPRYIHLQENRGAEAREDSLFTIELADNSLYGLAGKLSVIDRGVNPQTGTIIIRLVFPNPHDELRAGMSCTVRVHNEDTAKQIVIPDKALVEQMGEYFVYIAKDSVIKDQKGNSSPQLVAEQRKVQPGQTINGTVIIKSGIAEGDKVIVDGVQNVHDGGPVTTQTPGEHNGAPGKSH